MEEHSLLSAIRAAIAATGTHSTHWGELRRKAFVGETAWPNLKSWCASNSLECELAFSQSSKGAQVQFRRLRPAATARAAADLVPSPEVK